MGRLLDGIIDGYKSSSIFHGRAKMKERSLEDLSGPEYGFGSCVGAGLAGLEFVTGLLGIGSGMVVTVYPILEYLSK